MLSLTRLLFFLTKFAAWMVKNRKINPKDDTVKLNLGSGLYIAKNWINLDINPSIFLAKLPTPFLKLVYAISRAKKYSHAVEFDFEDYIRILRENKFVFHNLEYGIPFPDESVDYIYTSHFFEHLYRDEALKLLKESYRVLKKDGIIRICVPDLEYAFLLYSKGEKEKSLSYFFKNSKADKSEYEFGNHKYMYDYDLLRKLLLEAGFTRIKRCSYKQGETPDIELLDNRPDETLFVEAKK